MDQFGNGTLLEIRKEAAAWLVEMDVDPQCWNRRRFVTWLKSSPSHMEEFLEQSALWAALSDSRGQTVDLTKLSKDSGSVIDLRAIGGNRNPPNGFRLRFVGLISAAILLGSLAIFWISIQREGSFLATTVGEQRSVRLPDGSIVHLNTNTQVKIEFTKQTREVRLFQGEALFTVKRDVARPFRVHSDGVQLEALGTQFNVRRRPADTILSVVEGRVAVVEQVDSGLPRSAPKNAVEAAVDNNDSHLGSSTANGARDEPYEAGRSPPTHTVAVLGAGEQVHVSRDGKIKTRSTEDIATATAWRQRQLVFSNTPLADVAAEVARYNAVPRIQVEGAALSARRINGVFAADDPDSLIQFLARDTAVSVVRTGDLVLIQPR